MSGAVIQRTFGSSVQLLVRAQKPSLAQLLLATGLPLGVLKFPEGSFVLSPARGSSDGGRVGRGELGTELSPLLGLHADLL